ncbi:MAG: peptidase M23, partial [Marinoscillum sp.]
MSVSKVFAFLGFTLWLLVSVPVCAQKTKSQLEKEKRENLSKIAEAEKILTDTETEKKATIG